MRFNKMIIVKLVRRLDNTYNSKIPVNSFFCTKS